MYKQSPSRNHRSKGIKVKHVLQICLLLAVCFWLIYQVKRSHDKRKEFDVKDGKVVGKVQNDVEILRFGRKDIPRVTDVVTDAENHREDEEDKEVEEEEDENKHEDEPEKEDDKVVEKGEEVDKGRGDGDDEIDENDLEKTEAEHEHEEELVDEDKEKEDNEGAAEENRADSEETEEGGKEHLESEENEDAGKVDHSEPDEINEDFGKEDPKEIEVTSDDQDHDGGSTVAREAREEQYKADDASSEVAHNVQTVIPETENVTSGNANEMFGKVNFGQENETKVAEKDDALIQSVVQPREDGDNHSEVSSNIKVTEHVKYEANMTQPEDNSLHSSTLSSLSHDQPENNSNSTSVSGERSALLLSNGTQTEASNLSQNATSEGVTSGENSIPVHKSEQSVVGTTQLEDAAYSNKTENGNNNASETFSSSNTTDISRKTNGTDAKAAEEDGSLQQSDKANDTGTTGLDENPELHSSDEGEDGIQHDPIDASDTSLTQEERESRTDLDTLPEIRSEVQNSEDTVAE